MYVDHWPGRITSTVAQGYIEREQKVWKKVHHKGRRLEKAERNYYKIEGESQALYSGILMNRNYLIGKPFKAMTDHTPLILLYNYPNKVATYRVEAGSLQV